MHMTFAPDPFYMNARTETPILDYQDVVCINYLI